MAPACPSPAIPLSRQAPPVIVARGHRRGCSPVPVPARDRRAALPLHSHRHLRVGTPRRPLSPGQRPGPQPAGAGTRTGLHRAPHRRHDHPGRHRQRRVHQSFPLRPPVPRQHGAQPDGVRAGQTHRAGAGTVGPRPAEDFGDGSIAGLLRPEPFHPHLPSDDGLFPARVLPPARAGNPLRVTLPVRRVRHVPSPVGVLPWPRS